MKKLILVFVAIAITVGAYSQTDTTNKKMNMRDKNNYQNQNLQNNTVDKLNTDGYVMQNGKIMQTKDGQSTLVDHDITLTNGTKISADGTTTKKDGSKITWKEGQHMDMSGNLTLVKTNKDRNMYLVPDSTQKN